MKRFNLSFTAILLGFSLTAQVNYNITRFTGTYSPVSATATVSMATGNDKEHLLVPIGFPFVYDDSTVYTVNISTNGWISFGRTAALASHSSNNYYLFNYQDNIPPTAVVAPWWDDLSTDTVGTAPGGDVRYELKGTAPNRTFTVQWTNVSSYGVATSGNPNPLNFQVILYETSNIIEFHYSNDVTPSACTLECASIGINSKRGAGVGKYLDAITGARNMPFLMLNTSKWPTQFIRFTPGSPPAALAAGTYTVGKSGYFKTLSEAAFALNQRGIAGAVVLELTDSLYDESTPGGKNLFPVLFASVNGTSPIATITIQPAPGKDVTIRSEGTTAGAFGNEVFVQSVFSSSEPVIGFVGTDYVRMNNIHFERGYYTDQVDVGLLLLNMSDTNGAQQNIFKDITIRLSTANADSKGIYTLTNGSPTSASGANSYNKFYNISVSQAASGIILNGAFPPDLGNEVGTTAGGQTIIGAAVEDDMGGSGYVYGIRMWNQGNCKVFNTQVRNITTSLSSRVVGISLESSQGISEIYGNRIYNLKNTYTTSYVGKVVGINGVLSSGAQAKIYNNFIYNLTSLYESSNNAYRQVLGIAVNNVTGTTYEVDFNSVMINNSTGIKSSSACFSIDGISANAIVRVRNNIFANYTPDQTGSAKHYAWDTPSATSIGPAGSVSDYNDLYIEHGGNGFVARSGSTDRFNLEDWKTAVSADPNSISVKPGFINVDANLHINTAGVDDKGNITGITWVTNDIDNQPRSNTPDIGADEFSLHPVDLGITGLVTPASQPCYTANEPVTVTITNLSAYPLDFIDCNTTVTVLVNGAENEEFTVALTDNALNSGSPLPPGQSLNVEVGKVNMLPEGSYNFNAIIATARDSNSSNDSFIKTIAISYGSASLSSSAVCPGIPVTMTHSSLTAPIQWQRYDESSATWISVQGATTRQYTVNPTNSVKFRAKVCGMFYSDELEITVYPAPPKPVIMNSGPTSFCDGGSVELSSSAADGYNWSNGAQTSSITVSTSGNYAVTITDVNGCQASSDIIPVTVYPVPPKPVITSSAGSGSFCEGDSIALVVGGSGDILWSPGGETGIQIYIHDEGPFSVTVTNDYGCSSPSDPFIPDIKPLPPKPQISSSGAPGFCEGNSVILSSSSATGNVWYPGGATTDQLNVTSSGAYSVTVYSAGGCSSVSDPFVVTVFPNPAVPVINPSGPLVFCEGSAVDLISSSPVGNTWSPGGETGPSITVSTAGEYSVTVRDENGCESASAPVTVTVNALPDVDFEDQAPICIEDGAFILTGGSPAGGNYSGPGVADNAFDPDSAGIGQHIITYTYQTPEGCSGSASTTFVVADCVGIKEIEEVFSVFPNPATGKVYIRLNKGWADIHSVQLYDFRGLLVSEEKFAGRNQGLLEMDINHLAAGIYTVHLLSVDQVKVSRLEVGGEE